MPDPSPRDPSPLRRLRLPVLLVLLATATAVHGADDDVPTPAPPSGYAGEAVRTHARALASSRRDGEAALQRLVADGLTAAGLEVPAAQGHDVLAVLPGQDPEVGEEVILLGAHVDPPPVDPNGCALPARDEDTTGAALLVHLAEVLGAGDWRPRRRIVFCAFAASGSGHAGAVAFAQRLPFPGRVVAMLALDRVGHGAPGVRIHGVGAYPTLRERIDGLLSESLRSQVEYALRTPTTGDHWPFHERGVPAFLVTSRDRLLVSPSSDGSGDGVRVEGLAAAARVVGTLAVGLADHADPLADPLGVASYLVREGPRFALDNLIERPDGTLGLARERGHAQRMRSGLSALVANVDEDQDPAAAWEVLAALEAREGPVRYRLVRRVADIDRAWVEGSLAVLPRLCCARAAQEDPDRLAAYAALGYRWIAPWATGTRRSQERHVVEPIVAAVRSLKVILDAGDLPADRHAALRATLGDRPALLLPFRPFAGGDLGPQTLPLARFRRSATWQAAMDAFPGLAPPVVYVPRGERLAQAIAMWAVDQPAGWDVPGSPQRKALRGGLGGRLVDWLARAE